MDTIDMVHQPPHYKDGGYECIDFAKALNFCRGSAFKYVWRYPHKGNTIQDLEKALRFIDIEITRIGVDALADATTVLNMDDWIDELAERGQLTMRHVALQSIALDTNLTNAGRYVRNLLLSERASASEVAS